MDTKRLAQLAGLYEDQWSGKVKSKKHAPEGLFADGTSEEILKWLKANHSELKTAMSSLNFYINRAGKNLTAERKQQLNDIKDDLRKAYGVNESLDLLRKLAGLPKSNYVLEDDEETAEKEDETEDETEEETEEDIVAKITHAAEGLKGEELQKLIQQVYDAGVNDGKASCQSEHDDTDENNAQEKQ